MRHVLGCPRAPRVHAAERWGWGAERFHASTLKVEECLGQVRGTTPFHVPWGSLISLTFYLGGNIAHIILSLGQVQGVQGKYYFRP